MVLSFGVKVGIDGVTDLSLNILCKSIKYCIYYCYFNEMSADLTKGSFGHFSSFYVIKIFKMYKISIFYMFLQESQNASNM